MQICCTLSLCNGSLVCLRLHTEAQGPSRAPQTRLKNGAKSHGAHAQLRLFSQLISTLGSSLPLQGSYYP